MPRIHFNPVAGQRLPVPTAGRYNPPVLSADIKWSPVPTAGRTNPPVATAGRYQSSVPMAGSRRVRLLVAGRQWPVPTAGRGLPAAGSLVDLALAA